MHIHNAVKHVFGNISDHNELSTCVLAYIYEYIYIPIEIYILIKYRYGNLSKHTQLTQQSPKLDLKPRFPADKTGILSPLPEAQRQQPRQRVFHTLRKR